jgi:hypothetical protein
LLVARLWATEPVGTVRRLLIWLSGANRRLLDQAPNDRPKYIGIGGAVLTTAAMAVGSATLALVTSLQLPLAAGICVGVCWGIAIMSLDRWLVASVGRHEQWYHNLLIALPRIGLAVILGLVISTPLVLRIFQPEIDTEINDMHRIAADQFAADQGSGAVSTEIKSLTRQVTALQATVAAGNQTPDVSREPDVVAARGRLTHSQADLAQANKAVAQEVDGTGGTHVVGHGDAYWDKVRIRDGIQQQVNSDAVALGTITTQAVQRERTKHATAAADATSQLPSTQRRLAALIKQNADAATAFTEKNDNDRGLLIRIDALHRLTDRQPSLGHVHWLLLIFITSIECLPVLVKFLMTLQPPTLYDRIVAYDDAQRLSVSEELARQERASRILDAQDRYRAAMVGREEKDAIIDDLTRQRVRAIADVAGAEVSVWRENRVDQLNRDPDGYFLRPGPAPPAEVVFEPDERSRRLS